MLHWYVSEADASRLRQTIVSGVGQYFTPPQMLTVPDDGQAVMRASPVPSAVPAEDSDDGSSDDDSPPPVFDTDLNKRNIVDGMVSLFIDFITVQF